MMRTWVAGSPDVSGLGVQPLARPTEGQELFLKRKTITCTKGHSFAPKFPNDSTANLYLVLAKGY